MGGRHGQGENGFLEARAADLEVGQPAAVGEQPFPAAYVGAEPIDGADVTLWYVAHVHYDQGFPFTAGPWVKVEGL